MADVNDIDPEMLLAKGPFDVVLSDMLPNTTGHRAVDAARAHPLCLTAFELARRVLTPKGRVVVKVFMGEDFPELIRQVRTWFKKSRTYKPQASLKESRETYLIAWEPSN